MSWEESRRTLFGMFMYRLGFVRRRDYEDLSGRYARLTSQYICLKEMIDKCVIADADKYEVVERAREGGAL